ncbi:hypothetical protein BHM03_00060372 [Ensete ventricosum]|nr:hypothetical protein BHM03_00060372 [Ensete ventricosum]
MGIQEKTKWEAMGTETPKRRKRSQETTEVGLEAPDLVIRAGEVTWLSLVPQKISYRTELVRFSPTTNAVSTLRESKSVGYTFKLVITYSLLEVSRHPHGQLTLLLWYFQLLTHLSPAN